MAACAQNPPGYLTLGDLVLMSNKGSVTVLGSGLGGTGQMPSSTKTPQ
jgi:hypothetical protein